MDKKPQSKGPSNKMMKRVQVVAFFAVIGLIIVVPIALFNKQILNYDKYKELAINQQTRDKIIAPKRGTIFDRNMKELAISADVEQVTIDPNNINKENSEQTAKRLSEILDTEYETVYEKLNKKTSYEVIKRGVEKDKADEVRTYLKEDKVKGVYLTPDTKRYYPQSNLAANLIGFTGTDGNGLEGIEAYYDKTLSGTPGRVVSARDAHGNELPLSYEQYVAPQDGNSIVLTIDEVVQYFLEKHLEVARTDNNALEGVGGIVMDVKTGEILAMATKPDYDLNEPFVIKDETLLKSLEGLTGDELNDKKKEVRSKMWRNKPVVDSYEPGSTFKIFTMAMAYEQGLVTKASTFTCPGYRIVGDRRISCWKKEGHGTQTLIKTLENSCNPAMMQLGELIGEDSFYENFKAFGFTEKTGIDLGGETTGVFFKEKDFNQVELAVSSFGQTFQITPLQLISAVCGVVNNGNLVKPHVVKEILDSNGKIIKTTSTEPVRQIVSEETSKFMREAMEAVVTTGTARNAYVKGYRVGGKTATSEKITKQLQTGTTHYIASFLGVAPMDDPQVAVLIMIDEPQGYLHQGGQIAAPVVGRVMADILPYLGVEPVYTTEELASIDITTPNLINTSKQSAESSLKSQNISYRFVGDGDTITDQVPAPGAKVPASATVILYMGGQKPTNLVTVPNIIGKSANDAKEILEKSGLYMRATGASAKVSGTVSTRATKQNPSTNKQVTYGTVINVEFTDTGNVSD